MQPETHDWGYGSRLTTKGEMDMRQAIDYTSKLKICGNCGATYPKEKDKCPQCGSEKLFAGLERKPCKHQDVQLPLF